MSRTPPAWPRPDGGGGASAPTSRSPSGPPSRVGARPQQARVRPPSSAPPWGRSTGHRRTAASQAARATAPEARGAARSARCRSADASHPGPRARVRCSGRVTARSSAGQSSSPPRHPRSCDPALTTRSPERASSRSDPGPTGASLPDRPRSDDQQPAPWLASAPHGAPAYPLFNNPGILNPSPSPGPRITRSYREILKRHGAAEDLVQMIANGSVETTQALMKAADVVVATGGGAMVKSAYSSGKPSYGVGAGNVPVVIDRDVDLTDAAEKIVAGASFDNGIICSHEQFVLTPDERYEDTVQAFLATGKVWYTDDKDQVQKLRETVFPDGHLNKDVVGKPAREIGAKAGIDIPEEVRVILVRAEGSGTEDILAKEKLCPVVAIFPYRTFEEAVARAKANLLVEGAGHSAAVHSNDEEHIRQMGVELPVSRLVVNQASALTAGGSLTNGFAPTTTLGCGSWGGNSISENLDYKHLMNVSRIGKPITRKKVPTDEEIWA